MKSHIGAVVIAQNEAELIERSLRSYYDHVDHILVSTDPERGHSGLPVLPDDTLDRVRRLDRDGKIHILEENFFVFPEPGRNETYQRQRSADVLVQRHPHLRWVLQVDADEEFLNFPDFAGTLSRLWTEQSVFWNFIPIFNILDDGRLLVVVDTEGNPQRELLPIANRPGVVFESHRNPRPPRGLRRKLLKWKYEGGQQLDKTILHYSYAKTEEKIRQKLQTWSHSHDFDVEQFFTLWKNAKTNWQSLKNFHPLTAHHWPALRPFSQDELRQALGCPAEATREAQDVV